MKKTIFCSLKIRKTRTLGIERIICSVITTLKTQAACVVFITQITKCHILKEEKKPEAVLLLTLL